MTVSSTEILPLLRLLWKHEVVVKTTIVATAVVVDFVVAAPLAAVSVDCCPA